MYTKNIIEMNCIYTIDCSERLRLMTRIDVDYYVGSLDINNNTWHLSKKITEYDYRISENDLKSYSISNAKYGSYVPNPEGKNFYSSIIPMALVKKNEGSSQSFLEKTDNYHETESSIKVSISFFIGMIFARSTFSKKYNINKLYHFQDEVYSNIKEYSSKFPDLIGINTQGEVYIVEAKGTANRKSTNTISTAMNQVDAGMKAVNRSLVEFHHFGSSFHVNEVYGHIIYTTFDKSYSANKRRLALFDIEVFQNISHPPLPPAGGPSNGRPTGGVISYPPVNNKKIQIGNQSISKKSNLKKINTKLSLNKKVEAIEARGEKILFNLDLAELVYYKTIYQIMQNEIRGKAVVDAPGTYENYQVEVLKENGSQNIKVITVEIEDYEIGLQTSIYKYLQNRDYIYELIDSNKREPFSLFKLKIEDNENNIGDKLQEETIIQLNRDLKSREIQDDTKNRMSLVNGAYQDIKEIENQLKEIDDSYIGKDGIYVKKTERRL